MVSSFRIDPDLKEIVFCTMVRLDDDGTDPIIRELESLLSRTKMHCDRLVILAAMTCNPDKPRRKKYVRCYPASLSSVFIF